MMLEAMNDPGQLDLREFAQVLLDCAQQRRIRLVLERSGLKLTVNQEGVLTLCLHCGPRFTIDQILETEDHVRQFCRYLGIDVQDQDSRDFIIERIINNFPVETKEYFGFLGLSTYIREMRILGKDEDRDSAAECVRRVELLLTDLYKLYVGEMLIKYLDEDDRNSVINTLMRDHINFQAVVEQFNKYEMMLNKGVYSNFIEEIFSKNSQISFFGDASIEIVREVPAIRNNYLAHGREVDKSTLRQKSRFVFDVVEQFVSLCIEYVPKVIVPVQYGVNEWGFRYIAYFGEDDMDIQGYLRANLATQGKGPLGPNKKYYLLETRPDFYPYEKAYCLHPQRSSIMYDPTIYYASYLRNIRQRLVESQT
jgi:hypothetical protein